MYIKNRRTSCANPEVTVLGGRRGKFKEITSKDRQENGTELKLVAQPL